MSGLRMVCMAIACACSLALLGCGLADIDVAAVGPADAYWTRSGTSVHQQNADAVACNRGFKAAANVAEFNAALDREDECLLKKGYTFIPRPPGYRNICTVGGLSNRFACRVWRGEISVQPGQPALPAPPINAGPPPRAPDYDRIIPPSSVLQNSVTNQSNSSTNRLLNNIRR